MFFLSSRLITRHSLNNNIVRPSFFSHLKVQRDRVFSRWLHLLLTKSSFSHGALAANNNAIQNFPRSPSIKSHYLKKDSSDKTQCRCAHLVLFILRRFHSQLICLSARAETRCRSASPLIYLYIVVALRNFHQWQPTALRKRRKVWVWDGGRRNYFRISADTLARKSRLKGRNFHTWSCDLKIELRII